MLRFRSGLNPRSVLIWNSEDRRPFPLYSFFGWRVQGIFLLLTESQPAPAKTVKLMRLCLKVTVIVKWKHQWKNTGHRHPHRTAPASGWWWWGCVSDPEKGQKTVFSCFTSLRRWAVAALKVPSGYVAWAIYIFSNWNLFFFPNGKSETELESNCWAWRHWHRLSKALECPVRTWLLGKARSVHVCVCACGDKQPGPHSTWPLLWCSAFFFSCVRGQPHQLPLCLSEWLWLPLAFRV